ncbi:MAG TPA: AAA family ATPase, partial [archaeon]|nr:AAA family ATPase [archaeon]
KSASSKVFNKDTLLEDEIKLLKDYRQTNYIEKGKLISSLPEERIERMRRFIDFENRFSNIAPIDAIVSYLDASINYHVYRNRQYIYDNENNPLPIPPKILLISGSNGTGKTTLTDYVIARTERDIGIKLKTVRHSDATLLGGLGFSSPKKKWYKRKPVNDNPNVIMIDAPEVLTKKEYRMMQTDQNAINGRTSVLKKMVDIKNSRENSIMILTSNPYSTIHDDILENVDLEINLNKEMNDQHLIEIIRKNLQGYQINATAEQIFYIIKDSFKSRNYGTILPVHLVRYINNIKNPTENYRNLNKDGIASIKYSFNLEDFKRPDLAVLVSGWTNNETINAVKNKMKNVGEDIDFDDYVGDAKEEFIEFADSVLFDDDGLRKLGKKPSRAVLLAGPPGTGKTFLTKLYASMRKDVKIMPITAADIKNKYYGNTEENFKAIFQLARQEAPTIIFFDDIDGTIGTRSDMKDYGSKTDNTLITMLLGELDGMEENSRVLVVGTTNRPDSLDNALIDPERNRMKMMTVRGPKNEEERIKVLEVHLKKAGSDLDPKKVWTEIGVRYITPAGLAGVVDEAERLRLSEYNAIRRYKESASVPREYRKSLERAAKNLNVSIEELKKTDLITYKMTFNHINAGKDKIVNSDLSKFLDHQLSNIIPEDTVGRSYAIGVDSTATWGTIWPVDVTIRYKRSREEHLKISGVIESGGVFNNTADAYRQLKDSVEQAETMVLDYIERNYGEDNARKAVKYLEDKVVHIDIMTGVYMGGGPSAGQVIGLAMLSRLTGNPVKHTISATGAPSIRGMAQSVGGVDTKAITAFSAGFKEFYVCKNNYADLSEDTKKNYDGKIITYEKFDDLVKASLVTKNDVGNFTFLKE